jgi:hypothetical protein
MVYPGWTGMDYTDFVTAARDLAKELRAQGAQVRAQGCLRSWLNAAAQLIIALTHMRLPNDLHLARSVGERAALRPSAAVVCTLSHACV